MNILFITLADIRSVEEHGIYTDLIREFAKNNHTIYVLSPIEKRNIKGLELNIQKENRYFRNVYIIKIPTGNIQKTSFIEKGISTLLLEHQLKEGIKRELKKQRFDLILYSTPPVTIVKPIKYIKKRDKAITYLMLKDITPQAIVDLGVMKTRGLTGIIYKYFKNKEKELYSISDYIGCMSQSNVEYLIDKNPQIDKKKVEICPNSVEVIDKSVDERKRVDIRKKYSIPMDKKVFIYGGNLGKPQGIPFIIKCLKSQQKNDDVFFLIVGDGTEFDELNNAIMSMNQKNVRLMKRLPKDDYDTMVGACDVGLIFLDFRFSVPNYPSRILSYMQAKIPVFAVTDMSTDVGKDIVKGGFGWWCRSDSVIDFSNTVKEILRTDIKQKSNKSWEYLMENFQSDNSYRIISKHFREN